MAIFHTRTKTFSRGQGHSSVAAAAYRAGMLLIDPRTGIRHDYRCRSGVVGSTCLAPEDAPEWALHPALLWAAAEAAERRKDATVAREFQVALPHELTDPQRSDLVSAIARALVERYGFAVQASIHSPGSKDGLNHHLHVLATTRRVGADGLNEKTRELDGGPSGRSEVEWVRETVAGIINDHLKAAGVAARVDHRSLKVQADAAEAQGDWAAALALTRQPLQRLSRSAIALLDKGEAVDRADENTDIARANADALDATLARFEREGRAMPVPEGHSRERARRERRDTAVALSSTPGGGEIRGVQGMRLDPETALALPLRTSKERKRAAQAAFDEILHLWDEGFVQAAGVTWEATAKVISFHAARMVAYVASTTFAADVRELLRRLKRLKHDASRFDRRRLVAQRADRLFHQAQQMLEHFDEEHPRPAVWSRREWSRRRARRLRAVEIRAKAARTARKAIGQEAQRDCAAQVKTSAEALETWSQSLLERYEVDADAPTASAVLPPALFDEPAPGAEAENQASSSGERPYRPRFH